MNISSAPDGWSGAKTPAGRRWYRRFVRPHELWNDVAISRPAQFRFCSRVCVCVYMARSFSSLFVSLHSKQKASIKEAERKMRFNAKPEDTLSFLLCAIPYTVSHYLHFPNRAAGNITMSKHCRGDWAGLFILAMLLLLPTHHFGQQIEYTTRTGGNTQRWLMMKIHSQDEQKKKKKRKRK